MVVDNTTYINCIINIDLDILLHVINLVRGNRATRRLLAPFTGRIASPREVIRLPKYILFIVHNFFITFTGWFRWDEMFFVNKCLVCELCRFALKVGTILPICRSTFARLDFCKFSLLTSPEKKTVLLL